MTHFDLRSTDTWNGKDLRKHIGPGAGPGPIWVSFRLTRDGSEPGYPSILPSIESTTVMVPVSSNSRIRIDA